MPQAQLTIRIWTRGRRKHIPRDHSALAAMFAPHAEHVASLCDDGYQSGQIVDDRFEGWWEITRSAAEA
jgi:hypothetical protein